MIYFVSDLHFYHGKMGEYCGRPDNFEELIFEGLKSIPKEDHLICLGDVCIGRDREAHERFIMPLQCKKTLIIEIQKIRNLA
jgi:calcineurin-like phosphoesterase family protein